MAGRRKARKKIGLPEYQRRRRELMALMEENSIAIVAGSSEQFRNSDVVYTFRQNSDFHYLTPKVRPAIGNDVFNGARSEFYGHV